MNKTYLIDVTVPQDSNVVAKEEYYEQLKNEVNQIWKTKMEIVPVVIGATGTVTKKLRMYTNQISNNINIETLQQ